MHAVFTKNIDSINNMLKHFGSSPNLFAIWETLINSTKLYDLYIIDGYNFVHNVMIDRKERGVAIYVKSNISFVNRDELSTRLNNDSDHIFIEVSSYVIRTE